MPLLAILFTAALATAASAGPNKDARLLFHGPTTFENLMPGDQVDLLFSASNIRRMSQFEIELKVDPPGSFKLASTNFSPEMPFFPEAKPIVFPGVGRVAGGGKSASNYWGALTLGTFSLEFVGPTAATIEVVQIALETPQADMDILDNLSIVVNAQPMNSTPIAHAGADQTIECTGPLTQVQLDGSLSSDPSGGNLKYSWTRAPFEEVITGVNPNLSLPMGKHTIQLKVENSTGGTDTDEVVIELVDTTPPVIVFGQIYDAPSAPNHAMYLAASGIVATDLCDPHPELVIQVSSNETEGNKSKGKGTDDWNVVTNDDGSFEVWVRAERSGAGQGRTYRILAEATDGSDNESKTEIQVEIAHDQRHKASRGPAAKAISAGVQSTTWGQIKHNWGF